MPPVKIKLPSALAMLVRSFGANPEMLEATAESLINSGTLDKIVNAVETWERIENKIDLLLLKLEEKEENGESSESSS